MNLQEFVTESLKQIMAGVADAQKDSTSTGRINPPSGPFVPVKEIEFDVAVTVSQEQGAKGGIGIFVGAVGIGAQGKAQSANTSVSRIKFSVPVQLPNQETRKN